MWRKTEQAYIDRTRQLAVPLGAAEEAKVKAPTDEWGVVLDSSDLEALPRGLKQMWFKRLRLVGADA